MIVGNKDDNYISESTEMTTWIVVRAKSQDLIDTLSLRTIYQGEWKKAAQYVYSHNDLFSPFGKTVNDRIAVIFPEIEGWTVIKSTIIRFEEALTIAKRLSSQSSTVHIFYQDTHCGYQTFGTCQNGHVISTISTDENQRITIRGKLNEMEEQFFAEANYWSFDLVDLLKKYAFYIRDFHKPSTYYLESSSVVVMDKEYSPYPIENLPLEIRQFDINSEAANNHFPDIPKELLDDDDYFPF